MRFEYPQHICPFKVFQFTFCEQSFRRSDLRSHQETCEMRIVSCPINELCEEVVRAKDLEIHRKNCY